MNTRQKAFIVRIRPEHTHGLDELNVQLSRGWRVVDVAPLGGAGVGSREDMPELCLAALVVVERRDEKEGAAEVVAQAEEETEEIVEELVEGSELSGEGLSEELEEERNGGGT